MKLHNITDSQPYEIPVPSGGFLAAVNVNDVKLYTQHDLEQSDLTYENMNAKAWVTRDEHYLVQYIFPYFDLDGKILTGDDGFLRMYRLRGELTSKGVADKRGKYAQPPRATAQDLVNIPYFHPELWNLYDGETVAITEGEKKAVCFMNHTGIATIAIAGKDNWHPKGDQARLNPFLQEALDKLQPKNILILADGDIRKYHIGVSFGSLASLLRDKGYNVSMPLLPHERDKIDDVIVRELREDDVIEYVDRLPQVQNWEESTARLRDVYHLQTRQLANGVLRVPANEANLITLMKNHPSFEDLWFNEDAQVILMGDEIIDETYITGILAQVQRNFGMDAKESPVKRSILHVAHHHRQRSPWKEYLAGLEWDGEERLGTWMIDYCRVKDTEMAREGPMKWMVGSVARTFKPGCKVDYMLITTGAQGIGKSSIPYTMFGARNVVDIASHQEGKDLISAMHRAMCANWEELAVMSDYNINKLKTIVTTTHDTFRRPYAAVDDTRARDFVMYGSTNEARPLPVDPTGQRRYVVVEMQGRDVIDFKALEAVRDQLWAEAVHLFNNSDIDYSMVQTARHQGNTYTHISDDYYRILDAVEQDYAKRTGTDKIGPSAAHGYIKEGTYRGTLNGWLEGAFQPHLSAAQAKKLRHELEAKGWRQIDQDRPPKEAQHPKAKLSRVWCVPLSILEDA